MDTNHMAYWIGVWTGAALSGVVTGLLPLIIARKQGRKQQGWIGFGSTLLSSLLMGLLLSVPVAAGYSLYLWLTRPKLAGNGTDEPGNSSNI